MLYKIIIAYLKNTVSLGGDHILITEKQDISARQ